MSEEELIKTLRVFEKTRVEQLEEPARNLFYAIMKIAGERDRLNNIIKDIEDYINFLVIYNQTISGKFSETQWGQDILGLIGVDKE